MATTVGVVVAAGGGTRFGGPKALARTATGVPWVALAVDVLRRGGCDEVVVVLGAAADAARPLVPPGASVVVAERWRQGMAASLAAGVDAATAETDAEVLVVSLVDLPGLPPEVVHRVLDAAGARADLARAVYAGLPGHPVVLGRDHWAAFRDSLHGDRGGHRYLEEHGATPVECGDLFTGHDVDRR